MQKLFTSSGVLILLVLFAGCAPMNASNGGTLTGQTWVLTELAGQPLVADSGISASFNADGSVSGSAGCNRYNGTYTTSGDSITFSVNMAMTMMMCEQAVMDQESAYINALGEAKTFSISGDQLSLKDASGKDILLLKAQSQDLAGTSWEAVNFHTGSQAIVGVITGTTLTAEFGRDGTIAGKSGCNNYTGSYSVDGDKIKIGPLASTMMACTDPEGVMEQETQYLAALQMAESYQVEGRVLELRRSDGTLVAIFHQK
jgi:heat shock protein HslJ